MIALASLSCQLSGYAAGTRANFNKPLTFGSKVSEVVRDGTGQLWATTVNSPQRLTQWSAVGWQESHFSPAVGMRVVGLWAREDGQVMALWNQGDDEYHSGPEYCLSLHRGLTSRRIGTFKLKSPYTQTGTSPGSRSYTGLQLFRGLKGPTWMVFEGRDFYRLGDDAKPQLVFHVPDRAILNPKLPKTPDLFFADIPHYQFIEDAAGRDWFWNDPDQDAASTQRLSGLLGFEKGKFTLYPNLPNLPGKTLQPVRGSYSGKTGPLYLAFKSGVFEIAPTSLVAKRVEEPVKGAFETARQFWSEGDDLYVVTGWKDDRDFDTSLRYAILWRRRAGVWKRLLPDLDKVSDGVDAVRSFLRTPEGLWVGSSCDGAWFIDHQDHATLINWERGLNLPQKHLLFNLRGNTVMVTGDDGTSLIPSFAAVADIRPLPQVTTFYPYLFPVQDAKLHIWAVTKLRFKGLSEWDGTRWITHHSPPSYKITSGTELALDAAGRIWIPSDDREGQTAIFDPKTDKWQIFPTLTAAILANKDGALPAQDRVPGADGETGPHALALKGPKAQITFISAADKLYLYDGKTFRWWKRIQIDSRFTNTEFDSKPFFGKSGRLCIELANKTFELMPSGWKENPKEVDPNRNSRSMGPTDVPSTVHLPSAPYYGGGPDFANNDSGDWDSQIVDNEGNWWMLKGFGLYRWTPALPHAGAVPVLRGDQVQPFLDGRTLRQVMIDPVGNVFFNTLDGFTEWVMVRMSSPLPDTGLKSEIQPNGSNLAHFSVPGTKRFTGWFSYRLDDAAWSTPSKETSHRFEFPSPGPHILEVRAVSLTGRPDASPAIAKWTVQADSVETLADYVQQLQDPDFGRREAAVKALGRQSVPSLPLLNEALTKAQNAGKTDYVWWLEAAIEECEGQRR